MDYDPVDITRWMTIDTIDSTPLLDFVISRVTVPCFQEWSIWYMYVNIKHNKVYFSTEKTSDRFVRLTTTL